MLCAAAVTIKGTMKLGLNLLVTTLHPMRVSATLMSSMLFNVALVLLSCLATIQFCSQVALQSSVKGSRISAVSADVGGIAGRS